MGIKGGLNTYSYVGLNPLNNIDADGLCFLLTLPNGIESGRDDNQTGAWGKWKSDGAHVEGPDEHGGIGVPWSSYTCPCSRTRTVDWRYYIQARFRMVKICLDCVVQTISEWNELGPKHYYRTQSMDVERKTLPGGLTMAAELWMDLDCEKKCDSLNH